MKLDKVLHLEDEPLHRMLLKEWCPDWGGEGQRGWFATGSLDEGVKILEGEKNNFQIVIVDLNLIDSWGIVTVETLRPLTVAPIVVMTGNPDVEDLRARSKELGIYGIIQKDMTYTKERLLPILYNAYVTWRDERIVQGVAAINKQVEEVTARRAEWIKSHARNG